MNKVQHTQRITDQELKTVNMIIANRENFKVGVREWLYSLLIVGPLKYICKKKRKDDLFRKGQKKI